MTVHEQYAEDLTLYAMGVLEGRELAEVDAHVAGCDACRAELERLRADFAALALSPPEVEPPARARERLLAAIGTEPQARPASSPASLDERRRARRGMRSQAAVWAAAGWLAAAGAVIVASSSWRHTSEVERQLAMLQKRMLDDRQQLAQAKEVLAVFTSQQSQHVTLVSTDEKPQPQGKAIYLKQRGTLVFVASDLPPVASGHAYELWLIPAEGGPLPAGVFTPDANGNAVVMNPPLPKGTSAKAFAVTLEPAGGSAAPTTKPMLVGAAT